MSTSISMSGVYGYRPHTQSSSRSAASSLSVTSKRRHTSAIVGPSCEAIHGTMASSRRSRSSAPGRATTKSLPKWAASGDERGQEAHDVCSQLGWAEHLGVVEEADDE